MTKAAFNKIASGLTGALAIVRGKKAPADRRPEGCLWVRHRALSPQELTDFLAAGHSLSELVVASSDGLVPVETLLSIRGPKEANASPKPPTPL